MHNQPGCATRTSPRAGRARRHGPRCRTFPMCSCRANPGCSCCCASTPPMCCRSAPATPPDTTQTSRHAGSTARRSRGRRAEQQRLHTNVVAAWIAATALRVLDLLPAALRAHLGLTNAERDTWRRISSRMFVPIHDTDAGPVFSQFEGSSSWMSSTGPATAPSTPTSNASTEFSRPTATIPTATRWPSRPTR
jgi:hypothetical protein